MSDVAAIKLFIEEKNKDIKTFKIEPVYGTVEEVSIPLEVPEDVN